MELVPDIILHLPLLTYEYGPDTVLNTPFDIPPKFELTVFPEPAKMVELHVDDAPVIALHVPFIIELNSFDTVLPVPPKICMWVLLPVMALIHPLLIELNPPEDNKKLLHPFPIVECGEVN